jgi:cytochrome c oxidase assembly protein subunit 15
MSRLAKMLWVLYPTNRATRILFAAGKEYDKGQVIIKEEALVAKNDFISKSSSTRTTGKNTRNMIMLFLIQSILEYINRLLGALAGIACIITFILSFGYREKKKTNFTYFLIWFLIFKLGKTVVDSVLNPFKIHSHAGCIINCSASIDCYLYRKKT